MSVSGGCHGGEDGADRTGRERARAYGASLPAGRTATLWRARMACDAAPARGRAKKHRLPAILELTAPRAGLSNETENYFARVWNIRPVTGNCPAKIDY